MSKQQRRGGLGRGLGALIPTAPPASDAGDASDETGDFASDAHRLAGTTEHAEVSAVPEFIRAPLHQPWTGAGGGNGLPGGAGSAETGFRESTSVRAELIEVGPAQSAASAQSASTESASTESGPGPVPGATFAELPVDQIYANARQPRQVFDEEALAELTHSIREFGVLQPVVVRVDPSAPDAGYELVMGERRLRAAVAAGFDVIPAIVRTTADDAMLRDALLENIHRAQLNPLEEAAAYQQLLEEFGATHDELAQRIGRSRPQVSNTIRLLNLPIPVQRRVAAGVLSAGHARALLSLDDSDQQDNLAGRIVAEGLSVRATEELVSLSRSGDSTRKPVRKSPASRITAPAVADLAANLSDVFDTRVRVDIGRRKGRITIEFASIDDLERIVAVMAPQLRSARNGSAVRDQADGPNEP